MPLEPIYLHHSALFRWVSSILLGIVLVRTCAPAWCARGDSVEFIRENRRFRRVDHWHGNCSTDCENRVGGIDDN